MKRQWKRWLRAGNWPIAPRLLAAFLLISLLPIVGLDGYINAVTRQAVLEAQIQHLESQSHELAEIIDGLLTERQRDVGLLAASPSVREFSTAAPGERAASAHEALELLRSVVNSNPYFHLARLLDREGRVILSTADELGQDYSFRPYFREALAGNSYVSDISISVDLDRPVIYYSAPVWDAQGQVVAVAVLRVLAEEIWERVEVEKDHAGKGSVAILFDEYGLRLAHSTDRSQIFKAVVPLAPEAERQLIEEKRLGTATQIEATDLPDLARGIREAKERPYFVYRPIISPEPFHAGAALLETRPWTVIQTLPESSFMAPITDLTRNSVLAGAGVALLVLAATVLVTRSLVRPIAALTEASRRMAAGDLAAPPIPPTLRGRGAREDEIGQLARAFEAMRTEIMASHEALEERVARRTQELATLNTVAATVSESLDLDAILNAALDQVLEAMAVDAAGIFLVEEDRLDLRAHRNLPPHFAAQVGELRVGESLPGLVAQTGEAIVVQEGVSRDPRLTKEAERQEGFESFACVPLKAKGKVVGVMPVATYERRVFSAQDVALLTAIGQQIGVAVENAQLYRQAAESAASQERVNQRLLALNRVGLRAQEAFLVEDVFTVVTDELKDLGFNSVVLLREDDSLVFRHTSVEPALLAAAEEVAGAKMIGYAIPMDTPALEALVEAKETVFLAEPLQPVAEAMSLQASQELDEALGMLGVSQIIIAPLLGRDRLTGLLVIWSPELAEDDVPAVTAFANQAAIALENARLYERLREERVEEQEALLHLSHDLLATSDTQEVMDRAVNAVAASLGVEFCSLLLPDDEGQHLVVRAAYGWEPEVVGITTVPLQSEESQASFTMRYRQPVVVEDMAAERRFCSPAQICERGIASGISVPMMVEDKTIGVMGAHTRTRRAFTNEEVRLFSLIANQTALALEKARLFDVLSERNRRLRRLYELAVSMAGDVTRVADQVVGIIAELLDIKVALVERLEGETICTIAMYDHGQLLHEGEFPLQGTPCEHVRIEGQLCIYNQVAERFPEDLFLQEKGLVAYVGLPVLDRWGEVIAVVNAMDDRPREFTAEDLELLHTLAQRVGLELERAKADTEVRRRSQQLLALNAVAGAVNQSLDLEEVLDLALDKVLELMDVEAGEVFLVEEESGDLVMARHRGLFPGFFREITRLKPGQGFLGRVVQSGQPLVTTDLATDLRFLRQDVVEAGFSSLACIPLWAKGKVVGTLDVAAMGKRSFDADDIALLTGIGHQIGVAVENARLFQETQRRAGALSAIAEVGGLVTAGGDLQATLDTLVEKIARAAGFEAVGIGLYDAQRGTHTFPSLHTTVAMDFLERRRGTTVHLEDVPVLHYLLQEKKPLLLDDPQNDPRIRESQRELAHLNGIQTVLTMPLLFQQELVGTLDLISTSRRTFSSEDVSLLTTLADGAATIIYNARLFASEQRQRLRAETLREVAGILGSTLDIGRVLDLLMEQLGKLIEYDSASVMLLTGDELHIVASRGFRDSETARQVILSLEDPKMQEMLRRREPLIIADTRADPRWKNLEANEHVRCWIGAPLLVGDRLIGLLNIDKAEPDYYTGDNAGLAQAFAYQAALAIENARLYSQVKDFAAELERKVEERTRALRESEKQLRLQSTALESAANAIVITGRDGRIVWANPAFTRLTGYTLEEALGHNPRRLKSGKHEQSFYQNLWETILAGQVWHGEIINRRKDGSLYTEEMTITPLCDERGEISHFIAIKQDISERKRAEAELRAAKEAAEAASRAKMRFLANMSHELRTPLNGILGISDAIRQGVYGELNAKQVDRLGNVHESGQHLLQLINDLLDLARVEENRVDLFVQPLMVTDLCQTAIRMAQPLAEAKQIAIELETSQAPAVIEADGQRLRQILLNLLSNAIKFTPEGGQVGLTVTGDADGVQFMVWDTGIGIAEEHRAQLFEPFTQVDDDLSRRYQGSGLGLALVKRLTELHGGRVGVESKPGEGSCFWVWLPAKASAPAGEDALPPDLVAAAPAPTVAAPTSGPSTSPPAASASPPARRVLIIEDDARSTLMVRDVLEAEGYVVLEASDGTGGLEAARTKAPDLILMDVQLPGMDGLEVTRQLKADAATRTIPIIGLTASSMPGDRERALAAGMDDYLTKPIDLDSLSRTVRRWTRRGA